MALLKNIAMERLNDSIKFTGRTHKREYKVKECLEMIPTLKTDIMDLLRFLRRLSPRQKKLLSEAIKRKGLKF